MSFLLNSHRFQTGDTVSASILINFEAASPINSVSGEVTLTGFNSYARGSTYAKYGTYSGVFTGSTSAAIIAQDKTSYGLGTGAASDTGAIDFTVEFFLYCSSSRPTTQGLIGKGGPNWGSTGRTNADRQGWSLQVSSGELRFYSGNKTVDGNSGVYSMRMTTALPNDNAWHHIRMSCTSNVPVFTLDGTVLTMAKINSAYQNDLSNVKMYCDSMPLVIGNKWGLEINGSRFDASNAPATPMDNIRIIEGAALNTGAHDVPDDW